MIKVGKGRFYIIFTKGHILKDKIEGHPKVHDQENAQRDIIQGTPYKEHSAQQGTHFEGYSQSNTLQGKCEEERNPRDTTERHYLSRGTCLKRHVPRVTMEEHDPRDTTQGQN